MFKKDAMTVLAESRADLVRYIVDFDYVIHDPRNLKLAQEEIGRLDNSMKAIALRTVK